MGIQSWLGLWFGLTLPAIILMYMFKRKYVDTTVPSGLLWERVLRNLEANRPWQRLQNRLLLWLQLLVAALLVFALMQPFMKVSGGGSAHMVIVADTSGSMSAQIGPDGSEETSTRLDLMKERIQDYVKEQGRRSDITLLSIGASPVTLTSRETDRSVIDQALDGLQPYYGPAAYRETLSLASALTREASDAEVVIFTDSYWKQDTVPIAFQVPVSVEKIQGEQPYNAAIEQFGISAKSDGGKAAYTGVAVLSTNASNASTVEVNLYGDEQLLTSRELKLEPQQKLTESFTGLPFAEVYRLELAQDDGYAADNESFAFGLAHGTSRVLLLTSGNLFLEKALQLSGAEVTRITTTESGVKNDDGDEASEQPDADSQAPPVPDGEFDLLVMDGSIPAEFKQGKWAELTAKTPLWTIGGEGTKVGSKGGRPVLSKHPITSYVSLSGVYFGTLIEQSPAWGEPVMKLGDQPIVFAGLEGGRPRLSYSFLLQDSDLPLSPEFPVMVSNTLAWMTSGKGSGLGRYVAGAQADIPIASDTTKAAWIPKSGLALESPSSTVEVARNEQGISSVQIVPEVPGLYAFEQQNEAGDKLNYWLAVTADPHEADWTVNQELPITQLFQARNPRRIKNRRMRKGQGRKRMGQVPSCHG
ncbi:VWA domain-containing protein [Paenibacillus sp. JCM 10914]|uniref:vWA domain-containing protein n=1 Tax=Paenibacillus sp. JCM 10914 TaxID=1236974 RepID=UPI0003CCB91E|nr:VWA domain-containing protein [Paenibacillus sp. JCM 10914]GAE10013.1 hypothetical protein JCM10914_6411 [Paenibacillus sp. JCM 10914]